jgi:hypothetical protein
MAAKVKTWVWVVVGIVVAGILCVIALAGVGVYFFTQHINTRSASPVVAARDFDQVTSRFPGQKPLIELDDRGRYLKTNTPHEAPVNARPPDSLNILAFNPEDGRIVNVTVPFWLLRLKMQGTRIDFNGNRMELEDLRLSVEDLERYGPTLIVDHRSPNGERVLVWSQ